MDMLSSCSLQLGPLRKVVDKIRKSNVRKSHKINVLIILRTFTTQRYE